MSPLPARATPRRHLSNVGALVWREWRVFRRTWLSPTIGSVVEPIVYLAVFGFGFGALVAEVGGVPYLDFMATGAAANVVLMIGLMTGAMHGFFRRTGEHLYDGLLSTPVIVGEIVTGEATWTAVRAAGATVTTLAVAAVMGVDLVLTAVWAPLIGFVGGFGFACLGGAVGARLRSDQQFEVVVGVIFAPMFVLSWTFFPLDQLPTWLQWASQLSPLTHLVALLRAAAFGLTSAGAVAAHATVLLTFTATAWILAVRWLRAALVSSA